MRESNLQMLGRIEGKVDSIIEDLKRHGREIVEVENKIDSLEGRTSGLEKKQYGILAVASVVYTFGLTFLDKFK